MINKTQKNHIIKLLNQDIRLDNRKLLEYRKVKVEYGISKSAEGSARVTIGDTIVLAGVKLEIAEPYPDTPNEGSMMVGAELLPLSNPKFELGPPGIQAIEIGRVVDRCIRESKAIDTKKLCIEKGEKVWIVIIDLCPINDAGNLFDACALAAIAAIKDTKFPEYDGTKVDYKKKTNKGLPLVKTPIEVTVLKIGDKFIVDPLLEEEIAVDARLTVAVDKNNLCALQKGGDTAVSMDDLNKMIDIAMKKSKELNEKL